MKFTFPISVGKPGKEMFAGIPEGARAYLQRGFRVLAEVSPSHYDALAAAVIESLASTYGVDAADLAKKLRMPDDEARTLLAAASLLATALSSSDSSASELVGAASAAGMLEESHKEPAIRFSDLIKDRTGLKLALEHSRVASEVLPSLVTFSVTVDLRFGPESDVKFAVPVAIVHLSTDAIGHEVWFQLNKTDVRRTIDTFRSVLKRMEDADEFAKLIKH